MAGFGRARRHGRSCRAVNEAADVREERAVQQPPGSHPALRVPDQPERTEAVAEPARDQADHVLEMLVVGFGRLTRYVG